MSALQNVADIYALSPMQQLMLLHVKTSDVSRDVLFSQIVYRISGPLDTTTYHRAWQHMVDRHPALRTLFVWQDSKDPVQVVRQQVTLPWVEHDWRGASAVEQEELLDQFLAADRVGGFDLLHPPAMRLGLMRLTDHEFWLVWSSHHLILDRWCIGLLFDELKTAYEAYRAGVAPVLTPAPRYRDYISWLAAQDETTARAYWYEFLASYKVRPLPLRSAEPSAEQTLLRLPMTLPSEEYGRLRNYATTHGLTTGTLVNAAWAVLLGAATGSDEALFGLTMSGRPSDLPLAGQAVGSFINNVPLRVPLPDEAQLELWLHDLQERQLGLEPFQHYSPAQVQAWSGLKTTGTLFDSLVVFQSPLHLPMPENLTVQQARGGMHTGYPLSLSVLPETDKLRLVLTYEEQRVPGELAKQLATALLGALAALPDLDGASLRAWRAAVQVTPPEAAKVMQRLWIGQERPYRPPRATHELALAAIWSELLLVPHPSMDDTFFALGGDSIGALQLFALVEERLGQRLPISLIFGDPTLAQMAAELVQDPDPSGEDLVLQPIRESGARSPLFYMHGIYGDVSSLRNFGLLIDTDRPIYGLEAIGLRPSRVADETIPAMAARYVAAIRKLQSTGPYYLGGFCFGGVLAYEVARQLGEAGENTAFLGIIEGSAPSALHERRPIYDGQRLEIIRQAAPYWLSENKESDGWRLRERLARKLGRRHNSSGAVQRDVETDNFADLDAVRPENQLRLGEVNKKAISTYVPRPYGGPVTLFRARGVRPGHALLTSIDPLRGWGNLAGSGVTIRYVHGTHAGILEKPYASDLAAQLNAALQQVERASEPE